MPKKTKTIKQKKLLRLISVNFGIKGFTKTMHEMMIEAGYKESSARQLSATLVGIKDELEIIDPLVNTLNELRKKAVKVLKESKDKFKKASLRDLIDAIDKLTKNIQLLSGRETDRHGFSLAKLYEETKDD